MRASSSALPEVVLYAAQADACNLRRLVAHSEACIVKHFDRLKDEQLCDRLSSRILCRIARGVATFHKAQLQATRDNYVTANEELEKSLLSSVRAASDAGAARVPCPRWPCKGGVEIVKISKKRRVLKCSKGRYSWPERNDDCDSEDCIQSLLPRHRGMF